MTYREHRHASDHAYLQEMLGTYKTLAGVARAAGVHRDTIYQIAKRCGFRFPPAKCGNPEWRRLGEARA